MNRFCGALEWAEVDDTRGTPWDSMVALLGDGAQDCSPRPGRRVRMAGWVPDGKPMGPAALRTAPGITVLFAGYLRDLPPAAQRLYELLSFKMYGALRNKRLRVRYAYSEFCTHAPHHGMGRGQLAIDGRIGTSEFSDVREKLSIYIAAERFRRASKTTVRRPEHPI